jgi:hypothetical protein
VSCSFATGEAHIGSPGPCPEYIYRNVTSALWQTGIPLFTAPPLLEMRRLRAQPAVQLGHFYYFPLDVYCGCTTP